MRLPPRQARAKSGPDAGYAAWAGNNDYLDDDDFSEEEAAHGKRPRGSYNCGKCGVPKRGHGEHPARRSTDPKSLSTCTLAFSVC